MPFRVLLVCTGNTCRSALAEAVLRPLVDAGSRGAEERGMAACGEIEVASAGTAAASGAPATTLAREVALRHGLDLSGHRSTPLTRSGIGRADLILAMAGEHAEAVLALAPGAAPRTFLLSEFAGEERKDVPDPMGGTLAEYEGILSALSAYLERSLPRILAMVKEDAP